MQVLFESQGRANKNKAVDLEDMKFHQCVRLARFENDRTISFIPPDGAFDLMCAPAVLPRHSCCLARIHRSTSRLHACCAEELLAVSADASICSLRFMRTYKMVRPGI